MSVDTASLNAICAFLCRPLPLTTLHNSFNIDYVDTENIYVPDEWELDRAKVKIGNPLGQGSFGMVHEGEAKDLYNTDKKSRKVAIKTVNNNATIQDRINFLNEASRMKLVFLLSMFSSCAFNWSSFIAGVSWNICDCEKKRTQCKYKTFCKLASVVQR